MRGKNFGIFALLIAIVFIATWLEGNFVAAANLKTLIRDTSLYGLISIGVAMVIITGGIDLSIGSLIALCGVMMVQVIDVRYEREDAVAKVVEIERPDEGDTRVRLDSKLPPVRAGDRFAFAGAFSESKAYLSGEVTEGDLVWLTTGNPVRSLQVGAEISMERIQYLNPLLACALVLLAGGLIGALHGVLVTKAHLQPFVVTLCGLLVYRGLARVWTGDDQVGLGSALADFKSTVTGNVFEFPLPFVAKLSGASESWADWTWIPFPFTGVLLILVAFVAYVFLQHSVAGRHLLAVGENEEAARFSGIRTERLTVMAYVVSGLLAALGGILFLLEWNSVQPGSSGNFYELYAIAAAVLGGCSLRGGRGAVFGVIAGAAVMRCLYKAIVVLGIEQQWEMVIIGGALLASVLFDEVWRRYQLWKTARSASPA
ncbi:ABC transporter permease [Rhodopirellula sp. JC740]|uniref:ABC transporter permease n=1 Tax=Rhodopirellula halodulae TaxID=2894198 RepID=A0ABS8NMH8_9BACT|nr:ABC transporter permease [Rhodopirellula sp. JC740]MCC9643676.1 ABC transporter permease [Rhodopirellula sp. JC740]